VFGQSGVESTSLTRAWRSWVLQRLLPIAECVHSFSWRATKLVRQCKLLIKATPGSRNVEQRQIRVARLFARKRRVSAVKRHG
jgi:hypothetical protein